MNQFILKDYASWKLEHHDMMELFHKNNNIIYQRIEPVFAVLDYIYDLACNNDSLDEDLETIFEIGFNYAHNQIHTVKIYFENLFQSNCDDFIHYAEMVAYLIYIYDLRIDLENHEKDDIRSVEKLNKLETYIENMIMERREDYSYVRDKMNDALKSVFDEIDYDYVSIIDIYVEIAENLGIFVYEDEELILGSEI